LFKVADHGRGIPTDHLSSIFERFQQVDASDSRKKGGTGLGLAICRSIVLHHDGQIWAESAVGQGSTFYIALPLAQPNPTHSLCPGTAPLVLVCDDDASVRHVVKTMLEQQGYRVLAVASGKEAIAQAIELQPSAILLNLMMPEMHGWETLERLKQHPETTEIPVMILSGLMPDAHQPQPSGITDWIIKPPTDKRLMQSLARALATHHTPVAVLIVEDDPDLAQILRTLFERHGIQTRHATTGTEAIQLSQSLLPNLLVLDLGLPEVDGFAVVDWLRRHNRLRHVPLVVYTARDLDAAERDRLKLGQTLFLTKGRIPPEEVEHRVIDLLTHILPQPDSPTQA
jgi:CheY-like chemotaxis protein